MDLVTTRRVSIAPAVDVADQHFVHRVLTHPECSAPFKWRGTTPPFEEFINAFFDGVLMCGIVRTRRRDVPVGVVFLSSVDLRDGHAFLSAAADPSRKGSGITIEGVMAAVEFAFLRWPLHKLYADVDEMALHQFRSVLSRYMVEEGRFLDHTFRSGRRVAVHRLALYRMTWLEHRQRIGRMLDVSVVG